MNVGGGLQHLTARGGGWGVGFCDGPQPPQPPPSPAANSAPHTSGPDAIGSGPTNHSATKPRLSPLPSLPYPPFPHRPRPPSPSR